MEEIGPIFVVVNWFERKERNEEEQKKLQRRGDTVCDEIAHALKDLAGIYDSVDDSAEAFLGQHDIRSRSGCILKFVI